MRHRGGCGSSTVVQEKSKPVVITQRLLQFQELPEHLQWNEYLTGGYRYHNLPWRECFKSLFKIHNETGNVWTHLLALVIFIYLTYEAMTILLWEQHIGHKITFLIFLLSAHYAFGCSTMYHLFMCHSEQSLVRFLRLDYSGIAGLIVGAYIPPLYYSYYCYPFWQIVYMTGITVIGGTLVVSTMFEFFHSARFNTARMTLCSFVAAFGVIPAVHSRLLDHNWELHSQDWIHTRIDLMYMCYILGMVVFLTRFPERFFPGKFNYWLHSHQLWHIFVFAGTFLHYGTSVLIFENWHDMLENNGGCLPIG